jgi:hypothetical protein
MFNNTTIKRIPPVKELITHHATTALQSDKVAQSAAAVIMGTGVAAILEWVTPVIGLLTAISGLILSIVFIRSKRKSDRRAEEKHQTEMKILNKQLEES